MSKPPASGVSDRILQVFRDVIGMHLMSPDEQRAFKAAMVNRMSQTQSAQVSPCDTSTPHDPEMFRLGLMKRVQAGRCREPKSCGRRGCRRSGRCFVLVELDRLEAELVASRAARTTAVAGAGARSTEAS